MRRIGLLIATLFLVAGNVLIAQDLKVTGTITDAKNGSPLSGATVKIQGEKLAILADGNGKYTITVKKGASLEFIYTGYKTKTVAIENSTLVNVALEEDAVMLDEAIVVAYGTAKKSSFTGSAEVVGHKKLENRSVASVTKALDGSVAGVQSTMGSGQPGAGASVIIRGFGSIKASSNPLYVVDGIPYDGDINAINPNDVESMSILKDASAGTLFGSRGANGVVMIQTKSGKNTDGVVSVNFKAVWGVGSRAIKSYDLMNAQEYLETAFLSYKHDEMYAKNTPEALAGINAIKRMKGAADGIFGKNEQYNPYDMPLDKLMDPKTGMIDPTAKLKWTDNWMDEVTAKNPLRQEYQLDVMGGSKKTKALASVSYLKEEGLLKTTSFDRMTGRMSVDHQPKDWFKMSLSSNLSMTNSNYLGPTGSSYSNVWSSAASMAPIYPVWVRDPATGELVLDSQGNTQFDYGDDRAAGAQQNFNSIATLYNDKYMDSNDNVSARSQIAFNTMDEKYGAFRGFTLAFSLGMDYRIASSMQYWNPYFGNGKERKGLVDKDMSRTFSYTFNQILTWNRLFGKHDFDIMIGHEYYHYKYSVLQASKSGFPFGGIYELAPGSTIGGATSYTHNDVIESYLSRLNYNYDNKYYFSTSFRTDASSRFQKDHRWGDFWSVGFSWRISEESFMKDIDWVDNLTYKISYGIQGNNALGTYYAWQSFYDLKYNNANRNGAVVTSLENKEVTWEKNGNLNTGIEAKLLSSRLTLGVEWYLRRTEDMLLFRPLATSLGFDGYNANVGDMKNWGWDLTLGYDIIKKQDMTWNVTAMGSIVHNKVTKLTEEANEIINGSTIVRVGEAVNSFFMARSAGVDPATGAQLYWVYDTDKDGNPGEAYISADKSKATASRVICGSRIPKLYGSISTNFAYKGFDFNMMTTYSIGGKIFDYVAYSSVNPLYIGANYIRESLRAWKQPGDITDIPRVQKGFTNELTDAALVDASYFAIKNIALGYTFDMQKYGLQSVRLFLQGDNIATFSHRQGLNPQYNFSGSTDYVYTPNRVISLGLNIKF